MILGVDILRFDNESRLYSTDVDFISKPFVVWQEDGVPDVHNLMDEEIDFVAEIFALDAITYAKLRPRHAEIHVRDAACWPKVEPSVLHAIARKTGAYIVNIPYFREPSS